MLDTKMTRKNFVGGNWKCNGTKQSIQELLQDFSFAKIDSNKLEVVIAPTALHVELVKNTLQSTAIQVGFQNISSSGCGAFTGEVAASQVRDFGLEWVIVGHSERRTKFGETDDLVAQKVRLAIENGLKVILCIGETLVEREAEKTLQVIFRQMKAVLQNVAMSAWDKIVVAYEPVWAIGTGVVATPDQVQEAHASLRKWTSENLSFDCASNLRIIYGGSVSASNCTELIALEDVDGFLVGGASLKKEFLTIIDSANH